MFINTRCQTDGVRCYCNLSCLLLICLNLLLTRFHRSILIIIHHYVCLDSPPNWPVKLDCSLAEKEVTICQRTVRLCTCNVHYSNMNPSTHHKQNIRILINARQPQINPTIVYNSLSLWLNFKVSILLIPEAGINAMTCRVSK